MKFVSQLLLLAMLAPCILRADPVLSGLNFTSGNWALIGVPLHNYHLVPIQEELGTFITYDIKLMERIQQKWDLEQTFEDKCDYHYSLKLYKDGELVRTLNLNLHCGYLSYDGFSYIFDPAEFDQFRTYAREIPWSRISFTDVNLMKQAIFTLEGARDVYWYEDVEPYKYPGFFLTTVGGLPWTSNTDSLIREVRSQIELQSGRGDFYLKEYFQLIRGDELYVRYMVSCDEDLARSLPEGKSLIWRSHLQSRTTVSILALGIDEQRYRKLMNQN